MANTVTAGTLWSRALDYADMTNSAFPDTNRKYDLLNAALSELHYAIVNTNQDYIVATPQSISVTSGTATYALPSDFYKALKVYRVDGQRRYVVRQYTREEADGLLAVPSSSDTWELHYIPQATLFTADGDSVASTYPPGSEDYIALHVAVRLLTREERYEQAGGLAQERDRLLRQIIEFAAPRDTGEASHVSDSYSRWRDPWRVLIGEPTRRKLFYRIEGSNIRVIEADPAGWL